MQVRSCITGLGGHSLSDCPPFVVSSGGGPVCLGRAASFLFYFFAFLFSVRSILRASNLSMRKTSFSRREFLRTVSKAGLAVGIGTAAPNIFLNRTRAATGENPSEFVRVGFIGVGGQGNGNLRALMKYAVAVCDVDKTHLQAARQSVEKANGRPARLSATTGRCSRISPLTRC